MRAGRPWIAVAVFVGIGGVLSAGALAQQGQGNRYTQFRYPAWNPHNAECIWGEAHVFGPMQADNDIDPGNCVEATERAEAYVTVRGEQIEAYGWAKDNCALTPATVSAAKSLAANDTNFTITLITKPIWCASLMRVDMKPMFTARAEVDSPGNAAASGMMESNCPVINQAKARIDGSVSSTGGTQNSVWSMTVFGNGASISTSDSVGGGRRREDLHDLHRGPEGDHLRHGERALFRRRQRDRRLRGGLDGSGGSRGLGVGFQAGRGLPRQLPDDLHRLCLLGVLLVLGAGSAKVYCRERRTTGRGSCESR